MAFQMRTNTARTLRPSAARSGARAVDALSDWQDSANAASSALAMADARTARADHRRRAAGLAFGSALAWWLVRDTRAAVREAVEATRRMAQHDLSQPIDTRRQDEIGGLLAALETMRQNLLELATGVRQASDDQQRQRRNRPGQPGPERPHRRRPLLETALASIAQLTTSVQETTATAQGSAKYRRHQQRTARSGSEMGQVVSTMAKLTWPRARSPTSLP
jgi:methyl-accepting chemotaxis protein